MGAGKSAVGKIVSEYLKLEYYDLDDLIEVEVGMSISEIFEKYGEEDFRDIETKILKSLSQRDGQVVATGGGVILREVNWNFMKSNGITVYLKASIDKLWNRIKDDKSRPLLKVDNPYNKMKELLSFRSPLYEKADIIIDIDNLTAEEVAKEVISSLKQLI